MPLCKNCGKQISKKATRCSSCAAKKRCEDPGYRIRMSKISRQLWKDPEYRALQSEKAKQQWEDPNFRAMRSEKTSEQMRRQWKDHEFRARLSEIHKKRWENPELRAMRSKALKQLWEDSEYRAMMSKQASELNKRLWEDPEHRMMVSECMKQLWRDPEYHQTHSGENSPHWKGGKSFKSYGPEWTEKLKEEVRKRDNCTCAICGGWGNSIHHTNYDKTDNLAENLITLCVGCHSKTNYNRRHWQALLIHVAKGAEMRADAFVNLGVAIL